MIFCRLASSACKGCVGHCCAWTHSVWGSVVALKSKYCGHLVAGRAAEVSGQASKSHHSLPRQLKNTQCCEQFA